MAMEIRKIIEDRYKQTHTSWLVTTAITISVMYFSSSEIWEIFDGTPEPEMSLLFLIYYGLIFSILTIRVHYLDLIQTYKKGWIIFFSACISFLIDLFVISISELLILISICMLPKKFIYILGTLLIGALPASLGVISLSTITSEYLVKRAKQIEAKISKLENDYDKHSEKISKISDNLDEILKESQEERKKFNQFLNKEKEEIK